METLAITSHLLRYLAAALAIYLCLALFRRDKAWGWLLLSAVFLEPFTLLLVRAFRGQAVLTYKSMAVGSDGVMQVTYRMDFPLLHLLAVVGLFWLAGSPARCQVETS
jgi:hypothetical protein